jgi:hypothetical protein
MIGSLCSGNARKASRVSDRKIDRIVPADGDITEDFAVGTCLSILQPAAIAKTEMRASSPAKAIKSLASSLL